LSAGVSPQTPLGCLQRSPRPLAVFRGLLLKGGGRGEKRKGRGWEWREGEERGGEGKKRRRGEGGREFFALGKKE